MKIDEDVLLSIESSHMHVFLLKIKNFNFLMFHNMKIQLKEISIRELTNGYKNSNEE